MVQCQVVSLWDTIGRMGLGRKVMSSLGHVETRADIQNI